MTLECDIYRTSEKMPGTFVGFTDDQVVPSLRCTRSKPMLRNSVASLENASESQLDGTFSLPKQKKTLKKLNDQLATSPIVETVGKIYNSSSSAVSFKVPEEISKVAKTDYGNTEGTPEEIEVFDVSAKGCNSATRRKVNHWFTEQCVSPLSLSGIETSKRIKSDKKGGAEADPGREEETIKDDHGAGASERSTVKFRPSTRSKEKQKKSNGGPAVHSDHILIDSDDSSVESGPLQRLIRRRTCRLESKTATLPTQRSRYSDRDNHSHTSDQPQNTKVNKMSYLRGTPPRRFKAEVSSPGSDDPYSFKASPRSPPVTGKSKGRPRGRKATVSKKKTNKESVLQDKPRGDYQKDSKEIIEENDQDAKLKKSEKEKSEKNLGIKTVVAYGKEPDVILFDDVLERNTDPFSSPADVDHNEGTTKQNQKKKVNKTKTENSFELSQGNRSSNNFRQLVDEISQAEDYDLIFSQQIRDDAEEYRKMFKKSTRDNPRNSRVSFDDDVVIVTDDRIKALHDETGGVNIDNENRSEAGDIVNESTAKQELSELDETRQTANGMPLHKNISTNVEKLKAPMSLKQKLRRSDPVSLSALEKGVYFKSPPKS